MTTPNCPHIAQKSPHPIVVEAGKTYHWCACGLSSQQPFCDGKHKGSGFKSIKYTAEESRTLYFCGCKKTGSQPLCDGSHLRL